MEQMTKELLDYRSRLASKISAIVDKIGPLHKEGENKAQGFKYVSYEHLYGHLRTLLPANGLAVIPTVVSFKEEYFGATPAIDKDSKPTKAFFRSSVTMNFRVVDTSTGYAEDYQFVGAANDNADKSLGKAITECDKRFFFKLFKVSSFADRDPDSDSVGPNGDDRKQPEPKAPRKSDTEQPNGDGRTTEPLKEDEAGKAAADAAKAEQDAAKLKADLLDAKKAAKKEAEALGLDPLKTVSDFAASKGKTLKDLSADDYRAAIVWMKG